MAGSNSCYQCGGNAVGLDGFCPDCGAMQSSRPSNVVAPSLRKQPQVAPPPPNVPPPAVLPPNYPPPMGAYGPSPQYPYPYQPQPDRSGVIAGAWFAAIVIVIVAFVSLAISTGKSSGPRQDVIADPPFHSAADPIPSDSKPDITSRDFKSDLSLVDDQMVNDAYGYGTITGTVVNNGDHTFTYVQVEFNIYDADHNQVGSTLANINNLEPHGTWSFKAIPTEKAPYFKFKGITAF